jgi:hypothetical protein
VAARDALQKIKAGADATFQRRANKCTAQWTFRRCAEACIAANRAGWRNAKHTAQWASTLQKYVYPCFGDKHIRDVGQADVLAAIEPEWSQ